MKQFYLIFNFFIFLFIISSLNQVASAHTARTVWSGSCSTPSSNFAYNKEPSFGTSYKYGTEYYHWTYTDHSKDYWVPGKWYQDKNGKWHYQSGYTNHDGDKTITVHDDRPASAQCSSKVSSKTGSVSSGTVKYNVTYSSSSVSSSTQSHYAYYVKDIKVSVDSYSYEDEAMPSPTCVKTYGNGATSSCTGNLYVSKDNGAKATTRTTCYKYTENGHSGEACTKRVYTKSVAITGPAKTYTGKHYTYQCTATFHDGRQIDVSTKNDIWSASPYSYIGTDWRKTGYTNEGGVNTKPMAVNDFYPADPGNRTYKIKCVYYPNSYTSYKNNWISDVPREVSTVKSVTHIGIKELKVTASGKFMTGPNTYTQVDGIHPDKKNEMYFPNYTFITGHWYNFKAYIQYLDGTDGNGGKVGTWRLLSKTAAPEAYWTGYKWYDGLAAYKTRNSYDTNMTVDGLNHRIPNNGKNQIIAEYFNRGVPYGGQTSGTYKTDHITRSFGSAWAHQIVSLDIKGPSSYNTAPQTVIESNQLNSVIKYTAWVTWSDTTTNPWGKGAPQNWTSVVDWEGDAKVGPGQYKFSRGGNGEKYTVKASFGDKDNTHGLKYWDYTYDKIEVRTKDSCANLKELKWGCAIPSTWQTKFKNPEQNFKPDPAVYGFTSWNEKTDPYFYYYKFKVTGVSNGTGDNQN